MMQTVISIAICDDEILLLPYLSSAIRNAFRERGFPVELHTFSAARDLLAGVEAGAAYTVAFLDIDLPEMDGIALSASLTALSPDTVCVYVSAKEDRVFDALHTHPFAFVRKSCFQSDLDSAVEDIALHLTPPEDRLCLITDALGWTYPLNVDRTLYVEAQDKYLRVVRQDGRDLIRYTLSELERDLNGHRFLRIHKSYLVNYRFIHQLKAGQVELADGAALPLSRYRAAEVRQLFVVYSSDREVI